MLVSPQSLRTGNFSIQHVTHGHPHGFVADTLVVGFTVPWVALLRETRIKTDCNLIITSNESTLPHKQTCNEYYATDSLRLQILWKAVPFCEAGVDYSLLCAEQKQHCGLTCDPGVMRFLHSPCCGVLHAFLMPDFSLTLAVWYASLSSDQKAAFIGSEHNLSSSGFACFLCDRHITDPFVDV